MVLPNMFEKPDRERPADSSLHPFTHNFQMGDTVWVKDFSPTSRSKWCKGTIKDILGTLTYNVKLADGHERKAHLDHLRSRATGLEATPGKMFQAIGTTQGEIPPIDTTPRELPPNSRCYSTT